MSLTSVPTITNPSVEVEKISPFHASYFAPDPIEYMKVGKQHYNPELPSIPEYCDTILDCAVLFGNTSLASMFGWRFPKACEFWENNVPLTEEERQSTLLNKKIKMIGLDGMPQALEYSHRMNIIDVGVVQNFQNEMTEETRAALIEADVWVMQQCLSYMPLENLKIWVGAFLQDRSRPKRFIYDFNSYFDKRDMTPSKILDQVSSWEVTTEKFYCYRNKTEEEFQISQDNGRDMCVSHYVVDFLPVKDCV